MVLISYWEAETNRKSRDETLIITKHITLNAHLGYESCLLRRGGNG